MDFETFGKIVRRWTQRLSLNLIFKLKFKLFYKYRLRNYLILRFQENVLRCWEKAFQQHDFKFVQALTNNKNDEQFKMKVMKTIFKVTLVFAFAAFANTLFAAGNLKVNILPASTKKAIIAISTCCNSNFSISVANEEGRIVYSKENLEPTEDYLTEFDLSGMEDGKYKLKVVSQDITTERTFRKTDEGIKVGKEKTMLKPFFGYKDGLLRCTYLNFPKENLTLYFLKKNQLLYTKELGKTFNVTEGMNLSRLEKGNYEVILLAGDREYSFRVDKE